MESSPHVKIYATTTEAFETSLEDYFEALRQERDELRNKLQAFEFANKSAGELLRDALATVKRQRQFIRTLYTSRKTLDKRKQDLKPGGIS